MPLKSGKGNVEANVRELVHSFRKTGRIGSSHPENARAAQKQAVAIAFSKEREADKHSRKLVRSFSGRSQRGAPKGRRET